MYQFSRTGADPVPLDFNTPARTDAVADVPDVPDPESFGMDAPCAPGPESLLAEIGLPAHVARGIAAERSAACVRE